MVTGWLKRVFPGLVLAALCVHGGPLSAVAQTKVSIANLIVSSAHLPLWIAGDQELFAGQGIVAEIRIVNDAIHAITPEIPFGVIGVPAAISAMAEGRDLKVVATLDSARVTGHLVAGRDIKIPADLRGKRIGVNRVGTGAWIHSILALKHLGLDPARDEIRFAEIMSVPQRVQGLEAGVIDATVVDPGQSAHLRAKGFNLLLDMYPADIQGVQSALVVDGAYSRQYPHVVERVVATLIEGMAFSLAAQNADTAQKTLAARMKISAPAAAASAYRDFVSRANRKPYASIAAVQNMQRVMALNDSKVLDVKIEKLIDDDVVRKLDATGAIDHVYARYGVK
jgi:ABC-type nitrate/sulfonate/bicarbonate transport system substrate-binding protein